MSPPSSRSARVCARGRSCIDGAGDLHARSSPRSVAFFALCAFFGEFVPLKVFTRGAEGEITTSTRFALAAMLAAGPLAALIALGVANLVADA